ncbi:MAG: PIG-L family deacetylase [Planctomycetes bacterium]|nr:PIG-L family deacetylase [Planctomycetota bacterium]
MAEPAKPISILAVGAHMDDCWLGMGATALKALRKGHTVTMVTAVSNYRKLPFLRGRDAEIKTKLQALNEKMGVRTLELGCDYMRLHNDPALVDRISQIVYDVKPDIVFGHAEDECNFDHTALGAATRVAAIHGECFMEPAQEWQYRWGGEVYQYTTGWQARDFRPDTFVDVSETIFDALATCNFFDELYAQGQWPTKSLTFTDHNLGDRSLTLTSHARFKFAQSMTFSGSGGYAEAFKSYTRTPLGQRKLAQI